MTFVAGLRRLWRHPSFRRLLTVRVAIQGADGLLQVALASFVLFSPERQPDAASIAAVLAVTLLPFSVLGPFVSVTIDRFSRRQILLVGALGEAVLALGLAAVVATGQRTGPAEVAVYGIVLVSISLTRYLLAALSASPSRAPTACCRWPWRRSCCSPPSASRTRPPSRRSSR